jgi:hypothetical protein
MNELANWMRVEVQRQSRTPLTEQEIERIVTDIVIYNFPICLRKYFRGKEWRLPKDD